MTTLNISNIQHFSVGDGPGIRTTVFLKGCNLRCPWCHNPETISPLAEELFFEGANKRVLYGKTMTTDEILQEVMEDEPFYIDGGVTVSGGEPMLQSEGVYEFFEKLKQKGVSTLIDTAGDVPWESFERVKNVTDLFYFDFKTWNGKLYSHIIHGDGKRIYDNLCRLISCGSDVHIRIPLIPEFNTSAQDCEEISRMLKEAGAINVDLLPFHRMGEAKYASLGKEYPYARTQLLTPQAISFISDIYSKYFNVSVEI